MPVIPADLGDSPSGQAPGVPYSPLYDDVYHAVAGAWAQARHVFLGGNGLPGRWQGRRRFVILETGFGLGNNFLATWSAWLRDARRCDHLYFISIEKHPLTREDLARVHGAMPEGAAHEAHEAPEPPGPRHEQEEDRVELARRLLAAWPVLTPGLHTLSFEEDGPGGRPRVTLLLGLGDIADLLPALVAHVDAFYLDGFAPAKNPGMWDEDMLARLNRLAAPGATAATWSAARGVRDGLARAGFVVERVPGFAGKRDMVRASYAPRHVPPLPAGGCWPEPLGSEDRHAIVLGAGLAGSSAALALCRQGWRVTLVDRHAGPAREASGNPGGLFHGVLHGEDGIHARAHRAAALATWRQASSWIEAGRIQGDAQGLLRLDHKTDAASAQALLKTLGLPPDHLEWVDQTRARMLSGIGVPSGGWLFHQAGWLHPAGFAAAMLAEAASLTRGGQPLLNTFWGCEVVSLSAADGADGGAQEAGVSCTRADAHPFPRKLLLCQAEDGLWRLTESDGGQLLTSAPTLVLCNAMDAPPLLATLPSDQAVAPFPLSAVRGQITAWHRPPEAPTPALPVAGAGYVLGLPDGTLLCGATTQHHDADPAVREADHHHNLAQAARLGVHDAPPPHEPLPAGLWGRTAWRATTPDRLPLVGALPWSESRLAADPGARRRDQVRLVPRQRGPRGGLYVLTGLGSRGITWSCLAGDLLAHWVTGSPCPVEADLRDAMDPARFLVRRMTKGPSDEPRVHAGTDRD